MAARQGEKACLGRARAEGMQRPTPRLLARGKLHATWRMQGPSNVTPSKALNSRTTAQRDAGESVGSIDVA